VISSYDLPQILGIQPGRKCGRAHKIAEHHREPATFGAIDPRGSEDAGEIMVVTCPQGPSAATAEPSQWVRSQNNRRGSAVAATLPIGAKAPGPARCRSSSSAAHVVALISGQTGGSA
jgi:hypothetical protein